MTTTTTTERYDYLEHVTADVIAAITSDPAHRRYWFMVDDCTSTASVCDEIQLDVRTWREAIEEAQRRWDRLTVHDQRQRDAFYVGLATLDEDDIIDYNSMRYEYTIK